MDDPWDHDAYGDDGCAPDGGHGVPDLVTGHGVYARYIEERGLAQASDDAIPISDPFRSHGPGHHQGPPTSMTLDGAAEEAPLTTTSAVDVVQRECLVWFNGLNIDTRPDPDIFSFAPSFVSDENTRGGWDSGSGSDEPVWTYGDQAHQDYSFDRDVQGCGAESRADPIGGQMLGLPTDFGLVAGYYARNTETLVEGPDGPETGHTYETGDFAVAVERGDCAPHTGDSFRFRGYLDFVDPNGVYHEVQEYDYGCLVDAPAERSSCDDAAAFDRIVRETTWVSPQDTGLDLDGDDKNETVGEVAIDPRARDAACGSGAGAVAGFSIGTTLSDAVGDLFPWTYTDSHNQEGCRFPSSPGGPTGPSGVGFDLGHKCNGTIQDLFSERLWITRVHAPVYDPAVDDVYSFALAVDTCAGLNIYESEGKEALGEDNERSGAQRMPEGLTGSDTTSYHTFLERLYNEFGVGNEDPLSEPCTDGSSFSFDDTARGLETHAAPPENVEGTMRGDTVDLDSGGHRDDCRGSHPSDDEGGWPLNMFPPYTNATDCFPEDHRTAQVDLYVYTSDPTGLYEIHAVTTDTWDGSGDGRAPYT